jgi:hypothetical protein
VLHLLLAVVSVVVQEVVVTSFMQAATRELAELLRRLTISDPNP